ncbi:MAG TPA: pseudouridine synthase [Dissulfurispiraceae bacterium]|nr:pseudouridine synthase [Dissulfurispiraceae bacterium]
MEERIQKIIASMGIASRRKAEEIISEGRVTVNGRVVLLGEKADASRDHIKVDGKLLTRREPKIYLMFNKPRNVVTSLSDPEGRPSVKEYLRGVRYRVFPVGRLDFDSEGLLLLTNDGDFANGLMHPSGKIPKTYMVKVKGVIDDNKIDKLRKGVRLEDGRTLPARVKFARQSENNSWIEVVVTEGKKRQVRRMVEAVGHPALKLRRVGINGIRLGGLKVGELRPLTEKELSSLREEMVARA